MNLAQALNTQAMQQAVGCRRRAGVGRKRGERAWKAAQKSGGGSPEQGGDHRPTGACAEQVVGDHAKGLAPGPSAAQTQARQAPGFHVILRESGVNEGCSRTAFCVPGTFTHISSCSLHSKPRITVLIFPDGKGR